MNTDTNRLKTTLLWCIAALSLVFSGYATYRVTKLEKTQDECARFVLKNMMDNTVNDLEIEGLKLEIEIIKTKMRRSY